MSTLYQNSSLKIKNGQQVSGKVGWRSPSNLAIVKYWGKHGVQLPRNPSISFTLNHAYTDTTVAYTSKSTAGISLDFYFEGKQNEAFKTKIVKFLESITRIFPFLNQLHFTIHSSNSFPHSSGIASSASSMSALALCLCSIERAVFNGLSHDAEFLQKASFVARLGSGSASRSVYPVMAEWGFSRAYKGSSDLYAIQYAHNVHDIFKTYKDAILLASKGEKAVSSRAGHALMDGNVYAESRYQQARQRCKDLIDILKTGDAHAFGQLAEDEALTLHALMMCSSPSYMLMRPNTLAMIEKIRAYRQETKEPLYFSLDAGPNIHLLYPAAISTQVEQFIKAELVQHCQNGEWIADEVGNGPVRI